MATKLKLGTDNNWATKKGNLLAYNDENGNFKPIPFDVIRASTATRLNKAGLIETVGVDEPRIDFLNNTKGHLLLEPQRQNTLPYSQDFSQWTPSIGITVTGSQTNELTGKSDAYKLETDGVSGFQNINISASTSGVNTYSVFAKKGTNNKISIRSLSGVDVRLIVNLETGVLVGSSGVLSTKIEDYGNDWYRISLTYDGSNVNFYIYPLSLGTADTGFIYIYGAQVEQGSYPTSYIPTQGSAVTRTEDFCNIPSGLGNVLNTSEGTLFVDVEVPRVSTTSDFERIVLSDQASSTDRLIFDDFGGNWRVLLLSSGNNVNKTIVSVTPNQRIRVAIAYSSTELRISYDGNTATTTSGSYTPTTTLESFKFSNKDGGSKWQGKIYQAIYFNTALTNAELITLTS